MIGSSINVVMAANLTLRFAPFSCLLSQQLTLTILHPRAKARIVGLRRSLFRTRHIVTVYRYSPSLSLVLLVRQHRSGTCWRFLRQAAAAGRRVCDQGVAMGEPFGELLVASIYLLAGELFGGLGHEGSGVATGCVQGETPASLAMVWYLSRPWRNAAQ